MTPATFSWIGAAIILLGSLVTAKAGSGGLPCIFRLVFHFPCPGCGLWRSMQAIWRGDMLLSLRYHPLGIPLLLACGLVIGRALVRSLRKTPGPDPMDPRRWKTAAALLSAFMVALWIIRMVDDHYGPHFFLW